MRSHLRILLSAFLVFLVLPITVLACLWDYDTLRMERSSFPNTLEIITGKFLRHSKEFYEWRIQDRLKKIDKEPNRLDYYDDLAVAYEKTGQHALAIEWILKKDKIKPGVYETYSNLGTFYILAGELEQGLPWIDKALAINPDAHFGRERYQKWLAEYALTRKKDGKIPLPLSPLPLRVEFSYEKNHPKSFKDFLKVKLEVQHLLPEDGQKATKGILGMMRFANHNNPLLLETLGDLLFEYRADETFVDAKRLAAFSYLKASYGMQDPKTKAAYQDLAKNALAFQTPKPGESSQLSMAELEKEFQSLQADADSWYAELKEKEIGWIQEGRNADEEFDKLFPTEPTVNEPQPDKKPARRWMTHPVVALMLLLVLGGIIALIFLGRKKQA